MNKLSRLGPVLLLPPAQFKRPRCSVYWIQFCCYRPHSSNGHVDQYIGFSSVATARTVQTATLFSISDSVLLLTPAQFKRVYRTPINFAKFCLWDENAALENEGSKLCMLVTRRFSHTPVPFTRLSQEDISPPESNPVNSKNYLNCTKSGVEG